MLEVKIHDSILFSETIIPYAPKNIKLTLKNVKGINNLQKTSKYINVQWHSDKSYYFYTILTCDTINTEYENYCDSIFNDELPYAEKQHDINASDLINGNTYTIMIYSMTEEYASYFFNSDSFGSIDEYSGNINNAYGIFTGLNSNSVTFIYLTDSLSIL